MTTTSTPDPDPAPPPGVWQPPAPGDHRCPCPVLNSLANGGYLPRDGSVTVAQLVEAISTRLGVTRSMATLLAKFAMARLGILDADGVKTLDLAALDLHGFLEHDASLTRRDARYGDAAKLVDPLLQQLLAQSGDGRTLSLEDVATAHQLRIAQSAADGHGVPLKAEMIGTFEAALLYQLLQRDGVVALADARDFFANERAPAHAARGALGWVPLLFTAARLIVMGSVPFSRAATRARKAARQSIAAAPPGCPFAFMTAEQAKKTEP